MVTDVSTELTEAIIFHLKEDASIPDKLRHSSSLVAAAKRMNNGVLIHMLYANNTPLIKSVIEIALRSVDWEVVTRSLVIYYGLTMPWTEDM